MSLGEYKVGTKNTGRYKNTKVKGYEADQLDENYVDVKKSKNTLNSPDYHHGFSKSNRSQQHSAQSNHEFEEIKKENNKLKKMLKQAQAKRIQVTKQCSELSNKFDKLEQQNMHLHKRVKDARQLGQGQKFRYEQLKFLNKELADEIGQLQKQNQNLSDKLKHHSQILEKKYQQLEERTYKRIQQALKRIKKGIHYFSTLTAKQMEKTKEIQIENLTKAAQILKGKYSESNQYQQEIQELMNPLRNIQDQLHQKVRQISMIKQENNRLMNEVKKHKKIEKQLLPQYKQAIEKLKKNLGQVRLQLTENEYQKCQLKKKYEQKCKQVQIKNEELIKENRKLKLENRIFEKKVEELEEDVEEEKQRLMGQNQLLKKLYKSQDQENEKRNLQLDLVMEGYLDYPENQSDMDKFNDAENLSYKTTANYFKKLKEESRKNTQQQAEYAPRGKNQLKKNYSANQLRASPESDFRRGEKKQEREKLIIKDKKSVGKRQHQTQLSNSRQKQRRYEHLRHSRQRVEISNKSRFQLQNFDHENEYQLEKNHNLAHQDQSEVQQQNSINSHSQQGIKNQILKIDQEIMEIQKTLDRELNMHK